jgi:hypothetical protein
MSIDEKRLTGAVRGVPPCKDCTERFQACWDHCPKDERGEFGYKAWKAEIKRVNKVREEYVRQNAKRYRYCYFRREDDD